MIRRHLVPQAATGDSEPLNYEEVEVEQVDILFPSHRCEISVWPGDSLKDDKRNKRFTFKRGKEKLTRVIYYGTALEISRRRQKMKVREKPFTPRVGRVAPSEADREAS